MARKDTRSKSNIFSIFRKKTPKTPVKKHLTTAAEYKADFKAVRIISSRGACEAAKALRNTPFLVREVPLLPLTDCSNRHTCDCKYKHLSDRRNFQRRDEDNGLPFRQIDQERRSMRDRRRSDVWGMR